MSATTYTIGEFDTGGSLLKTYHLPFNKLDATAAPTMSDDDTAGYVAGSIWVDRTAHKVYVCQDNSSSAAVWAEIPGSGSGSITIGNPVSGGTSTRILYVDGSGNLAQSNDLTYDAVAGFIANINAADIVGSFISATYSATLCDSTSMSAGVFAHAGKTVSLANDVYSLILSDGSTSINGVPYSWPATDGAGSLTSDGAGNLSWSPSGGIPTQITVADTTDSTCWVGLFESATGDLAPKTDGGLTYNATTGVLTATGFGGPLVGNVTGNVSGSAGSCTGNAATVTTNANLTGPITSIGNATTIADAELVAIAGLTSAADKGIMFTGSGTAATYTLTAAALTVLDDTTVSAMVDTLGGASATGTGGIARAASPTFTGTPAAPTATAGTNTTQLATTAFVTTAVASAGGGTVTGTGTDEHVMRWDGTTAAQDSLVTIDDSGNTNIPGVVIASNGGSFSITDSGASAASQVLTLSKFTSGTPANGIGCFISMVSQDNGGGAQIAYITATWATATHASRKGRLVLSVWDTAQREFLRGGASGSAAMIGFLGASEVVQQTGDIGTALVTFGLMSGTPTFAYANLTGAPTSGDALTTNPLSQFAATTSLQLKGVISDETGSGALVFATSPTLVTPLLGTPTSGVLTNCTGTASGLTSGNVTTNANLTGDVTSVGNTTTIPAGTVTLAMMANLAQDQFIGRTTASTGVPQTATITAAARTVLDDTTVVAMVDTLGGASSTGSGGIARATSPTFVTPLLGTPTSGILTNCTGTAAGLTAGAATILATTRAIYGNNFDGSAPLTQIIASTYGGTGNGFTKFTGPATGEKTFTLPNATATILTDNAAVTVAQGGSGRASTTAYAVICGGTTSTGAEQSIASVGTSGQVLTSNGASALPTFQTASGGASAAAQSDQETGTSTTTYVSPGRQQFHASAAKAWVIYNTVTSTSISASYNVASLTDNGAGDTTITFTTAFSSVNYCGVGMCGTGGGLAYGIFGPFNTTPTTTAFRVVTGIANVSANDVAYASVAFFGDQ